MAHYFVGNFHYPVKFFNSFGFCAESYEYILTFGEILDFISEAFFAPAVGFFYSTPVCGNEVFEFSYNSFKCFFLYGLTMYMTS